MTHSYFSAQNKKSPRGIKWAGTRLSRKLAALFLCMALSVFPGAMHAQTIPPNTCQNFGIVGNPHADINGCQNQCRVNTEKAANNCAGYVTVDRQDVDHCQVLCGFTCEGQTKPASP